MKKLGVRRSDVRIVDVGGKKQRCVYTREIGHRMGLSVGVESLKSLGFNPVYEEQTRALWLESDYPQMCYKLAAYVAGRVSS